MMEEEQKERSNKLMGRDMDRPLPPQGCSWGFYIFIALIFIGLIIAFFIYKIRS